VLGALLADRAEQQIGEAAVAAGADYQQVSFADGVDQHSSRWAFGDNALDLELVLLAELAGRALEPLLCLPLIVDGVVDGFGAVRLTDERGNQRLAIGPGVNCSQGNATQTRLGDCPPQRLARALGTVDSNNHCWQLPRLFTAAHVATRF
jgi:hypothetical protein